MRPANEGVLFIQTMEGEIAEPDKGLTIVGIRIVIIFP